MKPMQVTEAHYVAIIAVLCLLAVRWLGGTLKAMWGSRTPVAAQRAR